MTMYEDANRSLASQPHSFPSNVDTRVHQSWDMTNPQLYETITEWSTMEKQPDVTDRMIFIWWCTISVTQFKPSELIMNLYWALLPSIPDIRGKFLWDQSYRRVTSHVREFGNTDSKFLVGVTVGLWRNQIPSFSIGYLLLIHGQSFHFSLMSLFVKAKLTFCIERNSICLIK